MSTLRIPVTINNSLLPSPAMNIWHARADDFGGEEVGGLLDVLEDFYTAIAGWYIDSTTITFGDNIIVDPYGSPEYGPSDPRTVAAGGGSGAGEPSSVMLALVVGWRTASASRSGRGRTFLGPIRRAALGSDGTPDGAFVTAATTAANALVTASTGLNGSALGIYSQKESLLRDITGVRIRDRWSYLSSRRD